MSEYTVAVIGGGLLGSAFGWGLARLGQRCVVFDEGDSALRAARGNFGLVWVQGKGLGTPAYAAWSLRSSGLWPEFALELEESTGLDLHYSRGGFNIAANETELADSVSHLHQIKTELGSGSYKFDVLDHASLKKIIPEIGEVPGATFCPHDGHCNPLLLLRALHQDMQNRGAAYRPGCPVTQIHPMNGGGYVLMGVKGDIVARAEKVIIAAGHGSLALGKALGIDLPIRADQGQVLVSEKMTPLLRHPCNTVRQTDNGSFLLGASSKDAGFDVRTDLETLSTIARRCIGIFPFLGRLRLLRAWGALRVMTPDGAPIYQQSPMHPGVFSFACHSGVTLAACHALEASRWVIKGAIPQYYEIFHPGRFARTVAE